MHNLTLAWPSIDLAFLSLLLQASRSSLLFSRIFLSFYKQEIQWSTKFKMRRFFQLYNERNLNKRYIRNQCLPRYYSQLDSKKKHLGESLVYIIYIKLVITSSIRFLTAIYTKIWFWIRVKHDKILAWQW